MFDDFTQIIIYFFLSHSLTTLIECNLSAKYIEKRPRLTENGKEKNWQSILSKLFSSELEIFGLSKAKKKGEKRNPIIIM